MIKDLWDSMLDADMNVRYWDHLNRRFYKRDKNVKIFLAIMASGTVASWGILIDIPILWKFLSGISAVTAIVLPIVDWPKSIGVMSKLKRKWMEIQYDYEELWSKRRMLNQNQLLKEHNKIKRKELRVSEMETNLPNDKKLLIKCQEEVLKSRGLSSK